MDSIILTVSLVSFLGLIASWLALPASTSSSSTATAHQPATTHQTAAVRA